MNEEQLKAKTTTIVLLIASKAFDKVLLKIETRDDTIELIDQIKMRADKIGLKHS